MVSDQDIAAFRDALPAGRVIEDPELIAPWTHDWRGKYHGTARAILAPRSTEEVATALRIAAARGVKVVPQGGNSSMVGGATPPADGSAVILSLRAMNHIRAIDPSANLALCEAGVILQNLHEAAETVGRRFPLSLGAKGVATVGGLISTNAGGTQVLRHGTMRAQVEGLEVVLPDGSILDGLSPLKKDNRGYDFKHLLIGAEGTLGVVTAASLRLAPAVIARSVTWTGLTDPAKALDLLRLLEDRLGNAVEGFELVSQAVLGVVIKEVDGARCPIDTPCDWHVLVEAVGEDAGSAETLADRVEAALAEALEREIIVDAAIAASETQAAAFWRLRESISMAERAQGPALQFDISVPISAMPRFMVDAAAACEARFPGSSGTGYGHLGDGNIHFHLRPPRGDDRGAGWMAQNGEVASQFFNDLVEAAGGSISAEHGIGQMKIGELARLASPARLTALASVKAALDPTGMMNPGKLVPALATPQRSA